VENPDVVLGDSLAPAFPAGRSAGHFAWPLDLPRPGADWPAGVHTVRVPTIQDARRLLGPASEAVRRRRSQGFAGNLPNGARTKLRLGMHDRGEEYVFAAGEYVDSDPEGRARHFPLHLTVVRRETLRIGAGEVLDLTASCEAWPGLNLREELYLLVKVDRLCVGPGSAIEVRGNIFTLDCGVVEFDGAASDPPFEVRIRGTRHPAYSLYRPGPAEPGQAGVDGALGQDSQATRLQATPFGALLDVVSQAFDGEPGCPGSAGGHGDNGQNGGMAMLADLRFGALKGFGRSGLLVSGQAGPGHLGEPGGRGGDGGAGGGGAGGLDGFAGFIRGGAGGRGGDGGAGGDGGRGGNGGLASHIFIEAPGSAAEIIGCESRRSLGGDGGAGGAGGRGGAGGPHGRCHERGSEAHAPAGAPGVHGAAGTPGRGRDGPQIHLCFDGDPSSPAQAPGDLSNLSEGPA
jgi:hypothetical protein